MVSLFASAVHAIENSARTVANTLGYGTPTRGWDGSHVWELFASDKVSRGEAYWTTRVELRPLEDMPLGTEEDAHGVSIVVRAKAWMPEDRRATWGRIVDSKPWRISDFKDFQEGEIQEAIEEWLSPAWHSAMSTAKDQTEKISVVADQRREAMDSGWDA
ncbi:hypothetical protein [Streptomyces kurssanovii]|uniref:Uncharacterized protein n=1 Tax=Streptomyces kurssanovii TaxID=67312 RepID=A0ABV3HVT4_9ACTN